MEKVKVEIKEWRQGELFTLPVEWQSENEGRIEESVPFIGGSLVWRYRDLPYLLSDAVVTEKQRLKLKYPPNGIPPFGAVVPESLW